MLLICAALAEPTVDPERGLYEEPVEVVSDALYYSLDHSEPSQAWPGSLVIEETSTLRLSDGSRTVTHSYVFVDDVVETLDGGVLAVPEYEDAIHRTLRDLPTIVLTHSYALSAAEQQTALEWIDGEQDTQIDCGVRIVGGHSVGYAKNNLRLNFRGEYGFSRLELDLYRDFATGVPPADDFDALTLRSGSHDSVFYLGAQGQYLRNRWMDETQLEMGHIAPHGRYAHVYDNGAYHGLFHVRERFDAAMLAEYLGGDEDDYEAVNSGAVIDGSGEAWAQALAHGYDFEGIQDWIDVENFLDYMILNFYAGNAWDWYTTHNWMAAGHSTLGGYLFHSSDSDICLYYDHTTDITHLGGPGNLFATLSAEGHEDFRVLLADRLHAHLVASEGVLRPEAAADRYERLSLQIEDAVVAESARWGSGWWTRSDHWEPERSRLLSEYFPQRTEALLAQVRAKGWLPLDAPLITIVGATVQVEPVEDAELWVTLDGTDPRDGGVGPGVFSATVEHTTEVRARAYDGAWGPVATALVEVSTEPVLQLNEWNAVDADEWLAEGDAVLGELEGNGGDWLELLVLSDLDMGGWRLEMEDRSGPLETVFLEAAVFSTLEAGALITVAEELPEDLAYAPELGDHRFHVAAPLDVSHREWTLTVRDDLGRIRLGPIGEGIDLDGLGSDEVGVWTAKGYVAAEGSSYGLANPGQDLSELRGDQRRVGPDRLVDPRSSDPAGCAGLGFLPLLLLVGCGRRTAVPDSDPACFEDLDGDGYGSTVLIACPEGVPNDLDCDDEDARVHPSAYEVCNDIDDDCDELIDNDVVDGIPMYADLDGDGHGGDEVITVCSVEDGGAAISTDCNDADAQVHPGAEELCDGVDRDCDGEAGSHLGSAPACAAESCLAIYEEDPAVATGAWWIDLESGPTELWCDMESGGRTLAFLRNSAGGGSHAGFGGYDEDPELLDLDPASASSSSTGRRAWIDLNAFPYAELWLGAWYQGASTYESDAILREDLRIDFGQDGYLLYGDPYVWCGGAASYTDSGVGAVNNPEGAPADCRGHGSLGSGWDFSESTVGNQGLTLCGADGSNFLAATWAGTWITYGTPGGAQAIWVR